MLEVIQRDGVVVVRPRVDDTVDANNADRFREAVLGLMEDHRWIVVNLQTVKFIDSSGLSALIALFKRISARGGEIKIACVAATVQSVFDVTRLHRIMDIYETEEEAIRSFEA